LSYRIQLDDNADFSSPILDDSNTSSHYTPSNPLADGTYYWRVRATDDCTNVGDWSSGWDFTIDTEAPSTPVLASPPNGETTGDNTPELDWGNVSDAASYGLEIDNNSDFMTPEIEELLQTSSFTPSIPLADGAWYWRVTALDECFHTSDASSTWSFLIDTQGPQPPDLQSPPDGDECVSEDMPEFDWSDVSGVVAYKIQVNNYPDFTDPGIDTTVENSTFTPSTPLVNDMYYWRVRSKDGTGNWGSWSSSWNFTIDTQGPTVGVLFPTPHEMFSIGETITILWDANDPGPVSSPGSGTGPGSGRMVDSGRRGVSKEIPGEKGSRGLSLSGNDGIVSMDSVETVDLFISRDGGGNWDVLFTDLENDGDENWEVTGPESDSCLIKVLAYDGCGNEGEALSGQFGIGSATGVGDNTDQGTPMPRAFALLQNYPNPFNPHTVIGYDVPETVEEAHVMISIYDARGRMVRILVDEVKSSGNHQVFWNGESDRGEELSSGIYFYVMRAGEFVNTRKMILLR